MISQGIEIRYIRDRDEQIRIAKVCHADPTSGHLGFRKTLPGKDNREILKIIPA